MIKKSQATVGLVIMFVVFLAVGGLIYYVVSNSGKVNEEKKCSIDSDCACGVNANTGDCFYGNKNYVDTSTQCPDFCGGIGGNLEIKCVNKECKQVNINAAEFCGSFTNAACSKNSDCITGGCSGQVCQGKNEEPIITTCEYLDCYDDVAFGVECGCVAGKCGWS